MSFVVIKIQTCILIKLNLLILILSYTFMLENEKRQRLLEYFYSSIGKKSGATGSKFEIIFVIHDDYLIKFKN